MAAPTRRPASGPDPRAEFRSKTAQTIEQMRMAQARLDYEARVEAERAAMEYRFRSQQNKTKAAVAMQQARDAAQAKIHANGQAANQTGQTEQPSMDLGFTTPNISNPSAGVNTTPFAGMAGNEMGGPPVTNFGQPGGPQPGSPQAQQAQQVGGPTQNGVPPYLMEAVQRRGSEINPVLAQGGVAYQSPTSETTLRVRPNVMTAGDAAQLAAAQQYQQASLAQQRDRLLAQMAHQGVMEGQGQQRIDLDATQGEQQNRIAEATLALRGQEVGNRAEVSKARLELTRAKLLDAKLSPVASLLENPTLSDTQARGILDKLKAGKSPEEADRLEVLAQAARRASVNGLNKEQFNANIKEANDTYSGARHVSWAIDSIRSKDLEKLAGPYKGLKELQYKYGDNIPLFGAPLAWIRGNILHGATQEEAQQFIRDRSALLVQLSALGGLKIRAIFPLGRAISTEAKLLHDMIIDGVSTPEQIRAKIDELDTLAGYTVVGSALWKNDPSLLAKPVTSFTYTQIRKTLYDEARAFIKEGKSNAQADAAISEKYGINSNTLALLMADRQE